MNHIRQGQNSKRSRGRGRKPQNQGNRAYDSNGPDVKIRGTATHVCEKYQQLARDALSAGDRVMAENYYQHAEHYYRLLMASQTVHEGQVRPQNMLGYRPDEDQEEDDEDTNLDSPQPRISQGFPSQGGGSYNQAQPPATPQGGQSGGLTFHSAPVEQSEPEAASSTDESDPAASANGAAAAGEGVRRRQNRRRRPRQEGAQTGGLSFGPAEEGAAEERVTTGRKRSSETASSDGEPVS